jgi:hypothetical protein
LRDMNWIPRSYTLGREGHKKRVKRIVEALKKESQAN